MNPDIESIGTLEEVCFRRLRKDVYGIVVNGPMKGRRASGLGLGV